MGTVRRLKPGSCAHCGLDLPAVGAVEQEASWFCCAGCATVFHVLLGAGLQDYYRYRDGLGQPPVAHPLPPQGVDWTVETLSDGDEELTVFVEGLHCAACVWLTERVVEDLADVQFASTSLVSHRMVVRMDPGGSPETVARALAKVGYRAVPAREGDEDRARRAGDRALLGRMAVAGALAGNLMMMAVPFYGGEVAREQARWFVDLSLILSTIAVVGPADLFRKGAVAGLQAGRLTVDLPLYLGIVLSWLGSVASVLTGGPMWFDSVAGLIFLLLVARAVERFGRNRALAAVPRGPGLWTARLRSEEGVETVLVERLVPGDRVVLGPGDKVPVDGVLVSGGVDADLSHVTGEPLPVSLEVGDMILGASLVLTGSADVEVVAPSNASLEARLENQVDRSIARRTPELALADRVAGWFVGAILLVSFSTLAYWLWADPSMAMNTTVAVLVVSCPCALALATPATFAAGLARCGSLGAVLKDGAVLLRLGRISDIVLDKTGTVTLGQPSIARVRAVPGGPYSGSELLRLAASVEAPSLHPLARSLVHRAVSEGLVLSPVEGFSELPGRGVEGWVDGVELRVGSPAWCGGEGERRLVVAQGAEIVGSFDVEDPLRHEAATTVEALKQQGYGIHLASGDSEQGVEEVARALGIQNPRARCLPEAKEELVRSLEDDDRRVLFVGDGNNDAPALASASVGLAMGGATGLAERAGSGQVLSGDLALILQLLDLGNRVRRTLKRNLLLALLYNALVLPLAASGRVGPLLAAVLMPLSSLLVVGSSLWGTRRR